MYKIQKRNLLLVSIILMVFLSGSAYAQDSFDTTNSTSTASDTRAPETISNDKTEKDASTAESNNVEASNDFADNNKGKANKTMFYAFLEEDPSAPNGPIYDYLKDKPFIRDIIVPHNAMERKFRPMMQWRAWAEKPQGFVASALFICLISFVCSWLLPQKMKEATKECHANFWKSFGTGGLIAVIWTILTRSIFLTEIGWPLGVLLNALFQAAMLTGFSVVVLLLGNSLNAILRIHRLPQLNTKANHLLIADLIVGSLTAALILQIPSFGDIPRIGARLVALFALLGLGSIYRIRNSVEQ